MKKKFIVPNNISARLIRNLIAPFGRFMNLEAASGITLIVATLIAMIWANSGEYDSYIKWINYPLGFQFGEFAFIKTLQHWVNDGLMVIFFYVVGLEIKRELIQGELSTPKQAALPIMAAIGGMVVPAIIYLYFNFDSPGENGWAIPMATDIAFAVGVLVLLGKHVPFALKVFLLALAIVDDLGAVVIIAGFYTEQINMQAMTTAVVLSGLLFMLRRAGVRYPFVYLAISICVWAAVLASGVHATISGVILGFLTPIYPLLPINKISEVSEPFREPINEENVEHMREIYTQATSPLTRWVHLLHPWVNFAIMPLFALVNAGVPIGDIQFDAFIASPISLGIILGLFLGKPIGIAVATWITCVLGLGQLPKGINWGHIWGMGFIAGIGFTMALFISHLSLKVPAIEVYSKMGILVGSLLSAVVGSLILYLIPNTKE